MFGWTYEEERVIHERIAYALLLQALPIFGILYQVIPAPWGKTIPTSSPWLGPLLPPRISWCLMECPNLIWCYVCLQQTSTSHMLPAHFLLLSLFALHYIYRALIYPYRMSPNTTRMPLVIVLCAGTFCTVNGYLQAQALCLPLVHFPTPYWERSATFLLGVSLFFLGGAITLQSDAILRQLRQSTRPGEHGIPYGGLFTYVSNPHYAGELLEWGGFCLASRGSRPSVAFLLYTAANLIPRAVTHHQWYLRRFPHQYPPLQRKAIIPFLW